MISTKILTVFNGLINHFSDRVSGEHFQQYTRIYFRASLACAKMYTTFPPASLPPLPHPRRFSAETKVITLSFKAGPDPPRRDSRRHDATRRDATRCPEGPEPRGRTLSFRRLRGSPRPSRPYVAPAALDLYIIMLAAYGCNARRLRIGPRGLIRGEKAWPEFVVFPSCSDEPSGPSAPIRPDLTFRDGREMTRNAAKSFLIVDQAEIDRLLAILYLKLTSLMYVCVCVCRSFLRGIKLKSIIIHNLSPSLRMQSPSGICKITTNTLSR